MLTHPAICMNDFKNEVISGRRERLKTSGRLRTVIVDVTSEVEPTGNENRKRSGAFAYQTLTRKIK